MTTTTRKLNTMTMTEWEMLVSEFKQRPAQNTAFHTACETIFARQKKANANPLPDKTFIREFGFLFVSEEPKLKLIKGGKKE
jgi:hypothetical protein